MLPINFSVCFPFKHDTSEPELSANVFQIQSSIDRKAPPMKHRAYSRRQPQHANQLFDRSATPAFSDDDVEFMFSLQTRDMKQPRTSVILRGNAISMVIDSGASVNVINETTYIRFTYAITETY
jgi:viroplasmin and RNaseH domain-containing protein